MDSFSIGSKSCAALSCSHAISRANAKEVAEARGCKGGKERPNYLSDSNLQLSCKNALHTSQYWSSKTETAHSQIFRFNIDR